jgi:hypothetical protein
MKNIKSLILLRFLTTVFIFSSLQVLKLLCLLIKDQISKYMLRRLLNKEDIAFNLILLQTVRKMYSMIEYLPHYKYTWYNTKSLHSNYSDTNVVNDHICKPKKRLFMIITCA